MYNENEQLFTRTMAGIFKNINFLCSKASLPWGEASAWRKVVVCVISDGRGEINPRTRSVLAGMGCYQDGIAKQMVNDKEVTAHIYEVCLAILFFGGAANFEIVVHYTSWHRARRKPCQVRFEWRAMSSSDVILLKRKESKKDQLSPMVFRGLW